MKLVVALDLTEKDDAVVPAAAKLAKASNADVVLLHVVNPFVDASTVQAPTRSEAVQLVSDDVIAYLKRRAAEFPSPPEVMAPQIQHGGEDVTGCLTRVAAELDTDILVVASKRVHGLRGLILGSVVQALLKVSPCPLLVVRPD